MLESEWVTSGDYHAMLKAIRDSSSESVHRKIACEFARMVWDDLTDDGRQGLLAAESLAAGEYNSEKCLALQKALQDALPKNRFHSVPESAVIWALEQQSASYPAWYAASIVASNIEELRAATAVELCAVIRDLAPCPPAEMLDTRKAT